VIRKQIILGFLLAVACALAGATKVPSKQLEELVAAADHIFVARIEKVDMVDRQGRELFEGQTGPGRGNTIRFHLTVQKGAVLKTNSQTVPDHVLLPLWQAWHYSLATQRRIFEGQTYIFLLKGEDYKWVYPAGFNRPLSEKAKIEHLLKGPASGTHSNQ
jgi:hypothetical protein